MTPADVERLIRVLRRVQAFYLGSDDRFDQGLASGLLIAINAIHAESEAAA